MKLLLFSIILIVVIKFIFFPFIFYKKDINIIKNNVLSEAECNEIAEEFMHTHLGY